MSRLDKACRLVDLLSQKYVTKIINNHYLFFGKNIKFAGDKLDYSNKNL